MRGAWVLRSVYRLPRNEIADALERVVDARQFEIESRDSVRAALNRFRSAPGDFSDYLVGERNRRAGCRTTMTFDRALLGSPLFEGI
jgi:predicted nucleic-acid-binding protein